MNQRQERAKVRSLLSKFTSGGLRLTVANDGTAPQSCPDLKGNAVSDAGPSRTHWALEEQLHA